MVSVVVNPPETVVHAASGGMAKTEIDICKTPTPGGPVPIPYPNIAMSAQTSDGSTTVKCDSNPIMLKDSVFSLSSGDEAGSIGGVKSSVIKGAAKTMMYSFDVKYEGKNVCRLGDPLFHNDKNAMG